MTGDIVFEEPPTHKRLGRPPSVIHQLVPLQQRPGQWARVHGPCSQRRAYEWAHQLRIGAFAAIEQGEYETRPGQIDGEWFVWARYVGNGA